MIRILSLTAVLATAIALPAIAQTSPSQAPTAPAQPTPSRIPAAPTMTAPAAGDMMLTAAEADSWIGKPVYSSDDKKVGEVIAFARASDNKVTEMHAGIGGFLGMGETIVRLQPAQIRLQGDRVVLNVTSAQAKELPKVTK